MNFALYEKSADKKHLDEIVRDLKSKNEVLRYYAAIVLSRAKDKSSANKAVPILKKAAAEESDRDLVDRAKLALMRIDPEIFKQPAKSENSKNRMLVIKAVNKKTKIETFSLTIPFALFGLAMDSLPDDAKEAMKEKGCDMDEILNTIAKKGEILKIESEDSIFKIWLE